MDRRDAGAVYSMITGAFSERFDRASEIGSDHMAVRTKTKDEMLTKTALKDRGWTEAGIGKFLGDPDATRPNPKYGGAAPMQLYVLARVKAAEKTSRFRAWKAKSKKRKDAALRAVRTKTASLRAVVEGWTPEIPVLDPAELRRRAIASFNSRLERGALASENSDEVFLARITVNYVRHVLTDYDDLLVNLRGKTGKAEAIELVSEQVYDSIGEAYPDLADECDRQEAAKIAAAMMREDCPPGGW